MQSIVIGFKYWINEIKYGSKTRSVKICGLGNTLKFICFI